MKLEQVLADHGAAISRVVASYAAAGGERDDLAQNIAMALMAALPRFRGDSALRTYVLRIAHNCGMKHALARRNRRTEPLEERDVVSHQPDPERTLAGKQDGERLLAAIRQLPIGLHQVIALALEGLEYREIAEVLGIQEGAAAVRLHRARQALKANRETTHG
jgi:RNA polymerase sigma factor (sigma-70 family)